MEGFTGFLVNKSGQSHHIFQRKFPPGHKLFLSDIWNVYEAKVKAELDKRLVSEEEFMGWLSAHNYMKEGFEYYPGTQSVLEPVSVQEVSEGSMEEAGTFSDGCLSRKPLSNAPQGVIDRLTYSDVANLRTVDMPEKIIAGINNIHKLRRAYTLVRRMPRKRRLERLLHARIQELERLS